MVDRMRRLMEVPWVAWTWRTVRDLWTEISNDRVGDLAASISFFAILAMPASVLAMVTAMGSLSGLLGENLAADTEQVITDYVSSTFESQALTDTVAGLFEQDRSGILTLSVAVALYSISRSFAGLVRALDVAYDIESDRSWLDVRLTALGLGLGTLGASGAGVYFLFAAPSGGPLATVVTPLVLLAGLSAWMATVFHLAPDHHTPWRYDFPGALFTAVAWAVLLQGYTVYVGLTRGGNGAVGVVSAALLAFSLVYLLAMTLLIGAEVNGLISHRAGIAQPSRRLHHLLADKELPPPLDRLTRRSSDRRSGR